MLVHSLIMEVEIKALLFNFTNFEGHLHLLLVFICLFLELSFNLFGLRSKVQSKKVKKIGWGDPKQAL